MYLKRLELHGFKSFASPTTLEFGTGVACVAGPNGAGKTNVAEAIRWVLGEHASRIIRARKTEDIVFSGSAKRAALGLAEVKITLDNSDHWLPLDFEEVIVSRRAYRSGENEYYINSSRVRLKDVNELFLKAQVGQNSYAFMGQGLVEQVLTLRPDERRGLIEEAADVRLHRDRLDEARRRLEATRENLDRAQLVVNEIEPRLRQLERQAERAISHARLSTELAQALQSLYGQQWQEAQDALTAARAATDQRKGDFESARRDLAACEEGLGALVAAIGEGRRDIVAREESFRQLENGVRDIRERVHLDEERERLLTARRQELAAEIESSRADSEQLAAFVGQLDERAQQVARQLTEAHGPGPDATDVAQLEGQIADAQAALTDAEARLAEASSRLAEAEGRTSALAGQEERLQAELAALQDSRRQPLSLLKSWALEFASRRKRALELAPDAQRAERLLSQTKTRLDALTASVARRRQECETLAIERQAAETRWEIAQGTDVDLPPPDAGVRAILAAGGRIPGEEPARESRIEGVLGMLGEVIRVPAGLERAIEAALADSLHAVVVERQEDALAAIELLIGEDQGRAMIVPLSDVRESHALNLLEERGVVGVASELVRCEQRYRPLVNTLLGRTIVAQNLGIAKSVLRRGMGNVVTIDGILLRQDGAFTAGSAKAIRRAMVHQREVGELPTDLERLRSAHKESTDALEADERERAAAQKSQDALMPEAESLRQALTQADLALRQHHARLPATAARLAALRIHRQDAHRSLIDVTDALRGVEAELAAGRALASKCRDARSKAAAVAQELFTKRERLTRWEAERSSRVLALEDEDRALDGQRAIQSPSLKRIEQELARREQVAAQLDEDIAAVLVRLETSRQELAANGREEEAARTELAPAHNSLQQLETRHRSMNEELSAARSRSLATERALMEAETAISLRSEELESLRSRLEEEGFRTTAEGEIVPSQPNDGPPSWLTSGNGDSDVPPMRGGAAVDTVALKERIITLRAQIRRLGPVNEQAGADYTENKERYDFLSTQLTDLREAEASLMSAIEELEQIIRERFSTTFQRVNTEFKRYFTTFFNGGSAELVLTKPDEDSLPGVDIVATPPRKRVRTLAMLSGGERSLTALALLFALLQTHPSPICVLDEVDAALDESNVERFSAVLHELSGRTQFIIITHNRRTLEMADTIYGVSMGEDSVSTVLSLKIEDVPAK
jgi:chromosome segregation protein